MALVSKYLGEGGREGRREGEREGGREGEEAEEGLPWRGSSQAKKPYPLALRHIQGKLTLCVAKMRRGRRKRKRRKEHGNPPVGSTPPGGLED